jgi:acetyl-CoA acetyltransferase
MKIEPVAFSVTCNGWHVGNISSTQDQAIARMISLNAEFPNDTRSAEGLYTEAQLRQLVEACAASCEAIAKGRNSVVGTRCADSVRRLIKELLS